MNTLIKKWILCFFIFVISGVNAQTSPSNQPTSELSLWDLLMNQLGITIQTDSRRPNMLHIAVMMQNYELANQLTTDHPNLITGRDSDGDTPLLLACFREDVRMIQLLIDKGANIDEVNDDQLSCLGILIYKGVKGGLNARIVYLTETFNPDIQMKDKDGDTPFLLSCFRGNMEIIEYFLDEKGIDINQQNNIDNTCLHYLAIGGFEEQIQQLTNRDIPPNQKMTNLDGHTPADLLSIRQNLEGERWSCPVDENELNEPVSI